MKMNTAMILDNEHFAMEDEGRLPIVLSFDDHVEHIREHLALNSRIALEHIKEHMYFLALDETAYKGTFEEFKIIVNSYIEWAYQEHMRKH